MVAKEIALVMPKMSMTMTEGVFVSWHKAEGDPVREGEVVCEVTTDKVDMEVEANVDGVLTRLVAAPEDVIAVGEPIAYVTSEADDLLEGLFGDTPDGVAAAEAGGAMESADPSGSANADQKENGSAPSARVAAVPAARRMAAERGIELATITPTGPWRTVRLADLPAAEGAAAAPGAPSRTAASDDRTGDRPGDRLGDRLGATDGGRRGGRAAVARRMSASAGIPQFVLYREMDLDLADRRRGEVSWTAVFAHVLASALRRHPELNATWTDGAVRQHGGVGVALAVDTERGLLGPVLADPDRGGLSALAACIDDVVGRARAGRLGLAELSASAATTLSNLGGAGVGGFQALLTPPQATALAVGTVEPKVVPLPGGVGVRRRCMFGLTVDHRVADGMAGARLLGTIQELLDGELV